MQRILITTSSFEVAENASLTTIRQAGFEIIQNPFGRRLTEGEVGNLLTPGVVGMIAGVEPLTRKVLTDAKDLRVISRCGVGLDNVDMKAAAEKNIVVMNTPGAPAVAVAELTVSLMLNLLRHVCEADRLIRAGLWKQFMGGLLQGKVVGLVGFGRIGRKVAELVRAFGASVLTYDQYEMPDFPGVEFCTLDILLSRSDIVSLHLPYSEETRHLFDAGTINAMKKGALLVNAARGGLIDETALISALESGHLAGAGLDCYETEPYRGPLSKMEQVVMTAHMGSYAKETRKSMEEEAAYNLMQELKRQGYLHEEK